MSSFQNVGYNVELSIALKSLNMGVAIINFPDWRISFETMSKDVDLLFGKLDISLKTGDTEQGNGFPCLVVVQGGLICPVVVVRGGSTDRSFVGQG